MLDGLMLFGKVLDVQDFSRMIIKIFGGTHHLWGTVPTHTQRSCSPTLLFTHKSINQSILVLLKYKMHWLKCNINVAVS